MPRFPAMTAAEAASRIEHGETVGFSGFTAAGSPKLVPRALADRARERHADDRPFRLRVVTGASTGAGLDDALAEADAIAWRAPFQSSRALRARINAQECEFLDLHLSHLPQMIEFGFRVEVDGARVPPVELVQRGRHLAPDPRFFPGVLDDRRPELFQPMAVEP